MKAIMNYAVKRYKRLTIDLLVIVAILKCVCEWKRTDDNYYFGVFLVLLIFFWIMKIEDGCNSNKKD